MTVFLCLYMVLCIGVTGALLEGSRLFACQAVLMMAKQTAARSILASYNRPLWEQYELLLWSGQDGQGNPAMLTASYADWLEGELIPSWYGLYFYGMNLEAAELVSYDTVLTDGGRYFLEQMLDAEESRGSSVLLELVNDLLDRIPAISVPEVGFRLDELLESMTIHRVVPRGTVVSDYHVPEVQLPSSFLFYAADETAVEKLLAANYVLEHCASFTDGKTDGMCYEVEYILGGNTTDSLNLVSTARKLIKIRTGINLALIASDSKMHSIAQGLGTILASCLLIPETEMAVTLLVEILWAYMEAVEDVQDLYAGKCIPIRKVQNDWHLWPHLSETGEDGKKLSMRELYECIRQMFEKETESAGQAEKTILNADGAENESLESENGEKNGTTADKSLMDCFSDGRWNYECYLFLLLYIEDNRLQLGRTMDVIQLEMSRKYPSFVLSSCCAEFELNLKAAVRPVFSALAIQADIPLNRQQLTDTVQVSFSDGLNGL